MVSGFSFNERVFKSNKITKKVKLKGKFTKFKVWGILGQIKHDGLHKFAVPNEVQSSVVRVHLTIASSEALCISFY